MMMYFFSLLSLYTYLGMLMKGIQIASMLSDLLGRKIVHIDLSTTELVEHYIAAGIPSSYAKMLSSLDTSVKFGSENRTNDVVLSVTGVAPRPFREFLEEAKAVWGPVSSEV
jgi:festuclavine dehydrogenase